MHTTTHQRCYKPQLMGHPSLSLVEFRVWVSFLAFVDLPGIGTASPERAKPSASKTESGAQRMVSDWRNDIKYLSYIRSKRENENVLGREML